MQQDAFFAPTTKTPYTDDVALGYQADLGRNMSAESELHQPPDARHPRGLRPRRSSRTPPTARPRYPGPINDPQSLWLGLDYFGYAQNPGSNFVIAHAERRQARLPAAWTSIFRKRYSNNWQSLGVLHLQLGRGQHQLRLERRLPG